MKLSLPRFLLSRPCFAFQNLSQHFFSSAPKDSLYRRISPLGDPNVSVVPVLDQWVQEGRPVEREELRQIIKELRSYKRFKHALEISQWMSDKRYIPLSSSDYAVRLNLILRVHGLEHVENYFNSMSKQLKGFEVYSALLNCCAHEKSVERAEAVMQNIEDMGYARTPLCYNIMMNLYYQTGNQEKLDTLMLEMEEKGIYFDQYTYGIRLSAYAAASDIKGIDETVAMMESNSRIVLEWNVYAIVAKAYLKVGEGDKVLAMLRKIEGLIVNAKKRSVAYDLLINTYAEIGEKSKLYRVWNLYKNKEKIYNKGYMIMIGSLLKFDDIEAAEKILKEWKSKNLSYDFRIPNLLIDVYCRNGLLEKAEALVNQGIVKGGKPTVDTWYYLAGGYLEKNQIPNAVEALKKVIMVCPPGWKASKETLATCLGYLEGEGDAEGADEFIKLLNVEGIFSTDVQSRLLSYIKDGKSDKSESGTLE